MEGKRNKYFRNVIKKCAATEVKCKKKQAIDQWKKKEIPNKKNTKASSHNFEDPTQAIAQIVTVPIADIHHEPSNKKIECDKDKTESCEIEIQELEVTIELEEMGDENVNSTERGGNILVKYSMKDETEEELIPVIGKSRTVNCKLYKALLPISKAKYNDLKKLCDTGVIPKIFHKEYLTLPTVNVKDVLLDTDIEDSEEEY